MLAAGFIVRRSLDDPQRGKAPLRLACVKEAVDACNAVGRVTVTALSPADIEKALRNSAGDPPYDAVVTVSPWPERLKGSAQAATPTSDVPLVSSTVVVARRAGLSDSCRSNLSCLVKQTGRVLFPSVADSTSGAIIAAQTMVAAGIDRNSLSGDSANAETVVSQLREATTSAFTDPITILTSGGALLDAVVDIEVAVPSDAPGLVVSVAVPPTNVRLRLLSFVNDERLASVAAKLRAQLTNAGWSLDIATGIPNVELMSATYDRLN